MKTRQALVALLLGAAVARAGGPARFAPSDAEPDFASGPAAAGAAEEYGGYLAAYPSSWRVSEARFRRGEMLEQLGRRAAAAVEWRRVYLEAPFESWGRQAEQKLGAERAFDAPELVTRATALF